MNNKDVLVSISCITFNHVEFIRESLEGMLMQKVKFEFEILIHDDASTDGTQEIIKDYQQKYPNIIKPILRKKNLYSQGVRSMNRFNFSRALGKYIALCEGDDYWTDSNKLQKQVDFMDNHLDYSMCFHSAIELWVNKDKETRIFSNICDCNYSAKQIYEKWTIPTASVFLRAEVVRSSRYDALISNPKFIYGDIILFLSCASQGKLYGSSEIMSVYRRHDGGVVSTPSLERNLKQCIHDIEIGNQFPNLYGPASYLCSARAINSFWHSLLRKKHRRLSKQFLSIFFKTKSKKYTFRYLRLSVSTFKHHSLYQ